MKQISIVAGLCAGLVLGLLLVAGIALARQVEAAIPAPESGLSCDKERVVAVSGAATINVVPDRVLVKLGVAVRERSADGALARSTETMDGVVKAIRGLGVAQQDIATDHYLVQPIYKTNNSYSAPLEVEGYSIDNTVAVTLKDAGKLSALLLAAYKAGANQVHELEFYTSELRRYRDEARTLAMQAAREKAELLAKAGGSAAGCVLSIDESSSSWYVGSWWGGGRDLSTWTQNVVQNAAPELPGGEGDDTLVSLGHIAVKAEVTARFSLR